MPFMLCNLTMQARAKANEIVGEHAAPVIVQFDTAATAAVDTAKATTGSKDVSFEQLPRLSSESMLTTSCAVKSCIQH
jgi:hypothetical protein